jgi:probable F420-dependent oxidoreductase
MKMIVSVGLPTCMEGMMYPVPFATPQQIVEIARHAEALGYHSVWGNDHMTTQRYVREEFDTPPNFWEPLITYSYLAAQTTRLRFGTGMLVTPMRRDLVVVAKQAATLDHFSGGRFILGFGVGAYREEFEALHPDWKAHRGELVEEGLQAMKVLFEQRSATWRGKYYHFEDVEMYPKPLQVHLPFYVGGNDPNASRRAATYADGWLPAGMPAGQMQMRIAQFKEQVESLGRDYNKIDVAPQLIAYVGKTHEQAFDRFANSQMYNHLKSLAKSTLKGQSGLNYAEINLVGAPAEVVEKAQRFAEAGVKHFCGTYFCADSVSELMDQMQVFSEEIMPHLSKDPI